MPFLFDSKVKLEYWGPDVNKYGGPQEIVYQCNRRLFTRAFPASKGVLKTLIGVVVADSGNPAIRHQQTSSGGTLERR
jgi:hypothetical protein